jgi:hypothetical protein
MMAERITKTSTVKIALAWLVVILPLAWGVYQSVVKSLPLFTGSHSG